MYPAGDVIRIICDNHSAHKSKEVQNYIATKPEGRYIFVFTPTHGSWLNLIESFFSKMTQQELGDRIYKYFDNKSDYLIMPLTKITSAYKASSPV